MSEYKIKQINVDGPPNEWKGPKGTVHYISVMLEGHDKIVSIGKKSPDALRVGDTVSGTIIPTDYLADKWKGETPQPGGSSSSNQGSDKAFLKDTSDLPYRVWKDMLPFMDVQQLIKDDSYNMALNEYVLIQAGELLNMIENVRSGSTASGPTPLPETKASRGEAADKSIQSKLGDGWSDEPN